MHRNPDINKRRTDFLRLEKLGLVCEDKLQKSTLFCCWALDLPIEECRIEIFT